LETRASIESGLNERFVHFMPWMDLQNTCYDLADDELKRG